MLVQTKGIMEDLNQDIENCIDISNISNMGISTSADDILSSNSEISSDVTSVNVDEWFKPINGSISSVDLEAVLKSEGMDSTYLDALGYHFLSPKDSIDMCIVTNLCDMGLGLELPGNACDKSKVGSLLSLNEKDCTGQILSDFQEQNPLLDDLERNDILEKDILVEVDSSELSDVDKFNLLHSCNKYKQQTLSVNYVLESNDETLTSDENSVTKSFKQEENSNCDSDEILCTKSLQSPLDGKDKVNWESFIISRQSGEFDSEKEVDFPEFNLLSFQVDPNDVNNVVSAIPQMGYCDSELNEACNITETPLIPESYSISEDSLMPEPCSVSEVPLTPESCSISETPLIPESYSISDVPLKPESCSSSDTPLIPEPCNLLVAPLIQETCSTSEAPLVPEPCSISEAPLMQEPCITSETYEVPGNSDVFISENSSILEAYNIFVEKEIISEISPADVSKHKSSHAKNPLDASGIESLHKLIACENQVPSESNSMFQWPTVQYVTKSKPTLFVRSTNPRSVLKTPLQNIIQTKNIISQKPVESNNSLKKTLDSFAVLANVNSGQENLKTGSKRKPAPPAMAIIAISTNKSKNTTEIVINTSQGEQKFKGKTSDLMKATSNIWSKIDNNILKAAIAQSLNITDTVETSPTCPVDTTDHDELQPWLDSEITQNDAVEQPITEALLELGIDVYNLNSVIDSKGQKSYVCPYKDCGKMFVRMSMLKVHILTHYGVRPYKCDYDGCSWTFYTYFKLKRHRETHLKRKLFICPVNNCGRRFTTIYNLNSHQKLHDRPAEMVCPVDTCRARFQTKRSMELHMKKHDSQHAPYKCAFEGCGKHYYSANSLNSHIRSHQHKEEELRCQWEGCGKLFDKPCRLKAHMRTHTGDKPYLCMYQDCGWAFSSASKLKRHQHKHTNERRFRCSFEGCNKSFMRSEHLKEHTLTHIGERTFHCTVENCGVKFTAKSSLYVHLKKHKRKSPEKIIYLCPHDDCKKKYVNKSALKSHMVFHVSQKGTACSLNDEYATLRAGVDDVSILEEFQLPTTAGDANLLSAASFLASSTMLSSGEEEICSVAPEYISSDLLESEGMNAVLVPVGPQSPTSFLLNQSDSDAATSIPGLEMQFHEDSEDDVASGSARTNVTYQDIIRYREHKSDEYIFSQASESPALRLPTDVVLGTGILGNASDITNNLLAQDDHTYPDDPVVSAVGDFPGLHLDSSGRTREEFSESTINLRDLE